MKTRRVLHNHSSPISKAHGITKYALIVFFLHLLRIHTMYVRCIIYLLDLINIIPLFSVDDHDAISISLLPAVTKWIFVSLVHFSYEKNL